MELFGAATVFGSNSASIDLRLPGQWLQAETGGLSQNWFRDYDPTLGRYIQPDPAGLEAGQNPYSYVDGDPLNAIDPRGLDVVVMENSGAVAGAGHVGMLVGNQLAGWEYMSKNGYGPGNYSDVAFSSLDQALNSPLLDQYDRMAIMNTSLVQDMLMRQAGQNWFARNTISLIEIALILCNKFYMWDMCRFQQLDHFGGDGPYVSNTLFNDFNKIVH